MIQESKHYTRFQMFSVKEISKYISDRAAIWTECDGRTRRFRFESNRFLLMLRDNFTCVACDLVATHFWLERNGRKPHFNLYAENRTPGAKYDILFTQDHILPKSQGGSNELDNLQLMCCKCNHKKQDRIVSLEDFRQERKLETLNREQYYASVDV